MISDSDVINIAKRGLKTELTVALIYLKLAEKFHKDDIAKKLLEFSEVEKGHSAFWRNFLIDRKIDPNNCKGKSFSGFISFFYLRTTWTRTNFEAFRVRRTQSH